jgi:hypothetical protein
VNTGFQDFFDDDLRHAAGSSIGLRGHCDPDATRPDAR